MPQDKDTPSMRALKSVGPSIKSIQGRLGMQEKKKKKPSDERSAFNPGRIYDETVSGLKGLKYLPDYIRRRGQ